MPLLQLIVLAIVQGVTEFLPISSSAHLILVPWLAPGWSDQGPMIDVAAHGGSLLAVLLYFRDDTARLTVGGVDTLRGRASPERDMFLKLAVASVPTLVVGAGMAASGAIDALRSPYAIAATSVVFGAALWIADRRAPQGGGRADDPSWADALRIGAAQVLALVPGVSRSGITMTAARSLGWSREEAARFSMLLAIPTIAAFALLAAVKLASEGMTTSMADAAIVAGLSFLSALAAIGVFMRFVAAVGFGPFALYRIVMGLALFAFAGRLAV